jgi:DNA-binding transcriptional MerR regulator
MNVVEEIPAATLQRFEPDADTVYPLDTAARIARVPRHLILVYYKHGLITPLSDPDYGGYYFTNEAIRTLQRIGHLHTTCGINLTGVRLILDLMDEVERLRHERGPAFES